MGGRDITQMSTPDSKSKPDLSALRIRELDLIASKTQEVNSIMAC